MKRATATREKIVEELNDLEPQDLAQVLDFIGYLRHRGAGKPAQGRRALTGRELAHGDIIGIWASRTDISDSVAYARRLRQQAEHR